LYNIYHAAKYPNDENTWRTENVLVGDAKGKNSEER